MRNKQIIFFGTLLICCLFITDLIGAAGGRGGGGGRSGGSGRSMQRSPSMSRSSASTVSRSQVNRSNVSRGTATNPRIGGNSTTTRNDIQQFIKNNPTATRATSQIQNRTSSPSSGNVGQPIQNRNLQNRIGNNVRNNVGTNYPSRANWFNRGFFDNHYYQPPYYQTDANWWAAASVPALSTWLGWENQPYYYYGYDNGDFVQLDDNSTVVNVSQQTQYNALPTSGNWMPLGVFAITKNSESAAQSNMFVQLALSKDGLISGTFYNTTTNEVYELEGSINRESQRVFWKIADNIGSPVVEAGLYNLTQMEVPVQVHFSNGVVQERLLVRVEN
jgi:hypothetical protein